MVDSIEPDLKVARNDALTVDEIRNLNCSGDNGRFDRFQFLQSIEIENSYVEPIEITWDLIYYKDIESACRRRLALKLI